MVYRLEGHPEPTVASMSDLAGIAFAIEQEAIRRFRLLAEEMSARGQGETADMFRRLGGEAERQLASLTTWANELGAAVRAGARVERRPPPEIASSWEEIRASSLLTPYRALAVAVANEERVFAFFSYLAAQATDPEISREAERLARQKLEHAALLRAWRRRAYRDASADTRARRPVIRDVPGLDALIEESEAAIAACHRTLSARLKAAGDPVSAALLSEPGPDLDGGEPTGGCTDADCLSDEPAVLLTAAQKPLERLSEALESVCADRTDEELVRLAQERLGRVVARIARIAYRREAVMRGDGERATGPAAIR